MTTIEPAKRASRRTKDIIWDAIMDLHGQEQVITREVLREVTGLRMTLIDEHVKKFIEEDETLRRVKAGVFQPIVTPPPARAVSVTHLPDGMVKVELGDEMMEMWPREARLLGMALYGHAQHFTQIQAGHEAGEVAHRLQAQMRRMLRALEENGIEVPPAPI